MLIFFPVFAYSADPVGRQVFAGGQFVQFPINSFQKYNNGMELNDWTRVRVSIQNLPPGTTWRYKIYTFKTEIIGEMPPNTLDLDYLKIQVVLVNSSGFASINVDTAPIDLSITQHSFVTGEGNGEFELLISYKLGIDPLKPLLGENPDYYFVDLEFHLESD